MTGPSWDLKKIPLTFIPLICIAIMIVIFSLILVEQNNRIAVLDNRASVLESQLNQTNLITSQLIQKQSMYELAVNNFANKVTTKFGQVDNSIYDLNKTKIQYGVSP